MLPSDLTGAVISGVDAALQDLNIDPVTIDELVSELTKFAETASEDVTEMPAGPLEGTGGGTSFAHHTDLARAHLAKALIDMAAGVTGFQETVREYETVVTEIDADSQAQSAKLMARLQADETCFTGPATGATSACVPSDATGGN